MRRTFWISIAVVILLILGVHLLGLPVRGGVQRVIAPAGVEFNRLSQIIEQQVYHAGFPPSEAYSQLQAEHNQLKTEALQLHRLQQENQQLKEEIAFAGDSSRSTVTAEIVNYNPDPSRHMVRIYAGDDEGIEPGMPVVARSALVGTVTNVSGKTADVTLLTDTESRVLARVEAPSRVEGVLQGQIGGGLVLRQLPRGEDIKREASVSTSGLDGRYPPGLLIGEIRSVARTPGEVLSTAQVTPAVSYHDLHLVTILKRP